MKPQQFYDRHLARWSSHPETQRRVRRRFQLLALVPLATAILVGLLIADDLTDWKRILRSAPLLLRAFVIACVFALSVLMTLALVARWSEHKVAGAKLADARHDRVPVDLRVLVVGAILGAMGPMVLARIAGIPPVVVVLFHSFALLPMVALLLGLARARRRVGKGYVVRRSPLFALYALAFSLLALTLVQVIFERVGQTAWAAWLASHFPWMSNLGSRAWSFVLLVPLAFVFYSLWRLWRVTIPLREARDRVRKSRRAQSCLERTWYAFLGWIGWLPKASGRRTRERGAPAGPPPWLYELRREPPPGSEVGEPTTVDALPEASPLSERDDLEPFFGGLRPTFDQVRLFDTFERSYRELLSSRSRTGGTVSADLLVEGVLGSGKTTALLACAIHAAFVRGQRVLFLVPDERRIQTTLARVRRHLRGLRLTNYVTAEPVDAEHATGWLGGEGLPNLFVATPRGLEETLYGSPATHGEEFQELRRILRLLEVVLVDDFMELDEVERAHLPFLLDKHRLFLESEMLAMEAVVCCPPLSRIARPVLATRLFGTKGFSVDRQCLTLHPRPAPEAFRVDITAADPGAATTSLIEWCLSRELRIVLLRPGIDEAERQRQLDELTNAGTRPLLQILSHVDELHDRRVENADAAIYQAVAGGESVSLALILCLRNSESSRSATILHTARGEAPGLRAHPPALGVPSETPVVLRVAATGQARPPRPAGVFPLLPDRTAEPMLVGHVRSVTRFLTPDAPMELAAWQKLGLRQPELPPVRLERLPNVVFRLDEGRPGSAAEDVEAYVVADGRSTAAQPVRMYELPVSDYRLLRPFRRPEFFVGRFDAAGSDGEHRRATWVDENDQELGVVDLAHVTAFRLAHRFSAVGPNRIEVDGDRVRIVAEPWHGNGYDRYLPVLRVEWGLPETTQAVSYKGGPDFGLAWCELAFPEEQLPLVEAVIVGLMDEQGRESQTKAIHYTYQARFSVLLFGPERFSPDEIGRTVGAALAGDWDCRGGSFLPALTCGLNQAFTMRSPGLPYFGRVLAFAPPGKKAVAKALAIFVEPRTSGRTIWPSLDRMMVDDVARREFFESVRWTHDALREDPDQLRRLARPAYDCDRADLRLAAMKRALDAALG